MPDIAEPFPISSQSLRDMMSTSSMARRPSAEEAAAAFRYCPGKGALIGSSDPTPWPIEEWRRVRKPFPFHAGLDAHWIPGSNLYRDIARTLALLLKDSWTGFGPAYFESFAAPWPPLYPVQLTAPTVKTFQVSIQQDAACSWDDVAQAIESITTILCHYGIDDLVVELRGTFSSTHADHSGHTEAAATKTPSSPVSAADSDGYTLTEEITEPDSIKHSTCLGVSIGPLDIAHRGSRGLYLRIAPDGEIVELTCRHVVSPLKTSTAYEPIGPETLPRVYMIQPPDPTLTDEQSALNEGLPNAENAYQSLVLPCARLTEAVEAELDPAQRRHKVAQLQRLVISMEEARAQVLTTQERMASVDQLLSLGQRVRVYGVVLTAPPYEVARDTSFMIRDWALTRLLPPVFPTKMPKNQVLLDQSYKSLVIKAMTDAGLGNKEGAIRLAFATGLTLRGTVSPEELRVRVTSSDSPLLLAKYGAKTGLTLGHCDGYQTTTRGNRVPDKAFCRFSLSDKADLEDQGIWEYCIINALRPTEKFSDGSDSGAAVWALDGRVAGILTGGFKEAQWGGKVDGTYMTSIGSLLADMALHGVDAAMP